VFVMDLLTACSFLHLVILCAFTAGRWKLCVNKYTWMPGGLLFGVQFIHENLYFV
jgi:hypothetical protein